MKDVAKKLRLVENGWGGKEDQVSETKWNRERSLSPVFHSSREQRAVKGGRGGEGEVSVVGIKIKSDQSAPTDD